jgi:curved DNA-binding protein
MKYKDYYAILGVDRSAGEAAIKSAYRKLARKYHPDVSKEPDAEAKFKDVSEAYTTLRDPEKRAAYDQLGRHQPGQDFQPPPDWRNQFGDTEFSFGDIDLSDLFAGLRARGHRPMRAEAGGARPGEDYEVLVHITLGEAYRGTEVSLDLAMPEEDARGFVRRVPRTVRTRIPKGATDGQRLRVPGKGGKGSDGGRDGDLYVTIALHPHPLFRVSGHDVYVDLPLAPWEAVLGTEVVLPTPGGGVRLTVPPGTRAGEQLRLAKRGLPMPRDDGHGDLYAIVGIAVPTVVGERERALFRQLAEVSAFDPRGHFDEELKDAPGTR